MPSLLNGHPLALHCIPVLCLCLLFAVVVRIVLYAMLAARRKHKAKSRNLKIPMPTDWQAKMRAA